MTKKFIKKTKQNIFKISYIRKIIEIYTFFRVFIDVSDAIIVFLVNEFISLDTLHFSFKAKKFVAKFVTIPLSVRKTAVLRGGFCFLFYVLTCLSKKTSNCHKVKFLTYCCHLSNIAYLYFDGNEITSAAILLLFYFTESKPKYKSKKQYLK